MASLNELLDAAEKANKNYDIELIKKAYYFAEKSHEGQFRLSKEPYITHPVSVALILIDFGMDINSVVAGLLHDVVEDTSVSKSKIASNFGDDVAMLVDGVTKLGNVPLSTKRERQVENIRKMLLAMSKDVRVIIIKLADRLHNMRTASGWPEQKRRNKSLETMEIYAPIAQRLGMRLIKEELEDIAIYYLDPIAYQEISDMLKEKERANATSLKSESYIKYVENMAYNRIKHLVKDPIISGRLKSHCGIYFKVYVNGKDWDEVFDIYAIRIIVNTVAECYFVLGAMHDIFTPLPNRFKDYISTPKPNMYQSLHTTVIGPGGVSFEIQIRTKDMHYTAEYGIAAHWKYKQKVSTKTTLEEKLSWIRRIIETQNESENDDEFLQVIKTGLGSEEVFVFTPNGEVKTLPAGSTIIDFAYSIHSEVGNKMIGAKVDGKMTQIESPISMNQVIEIITTKIKSHGPSRRWLRIVKTNEARNKIRAWFKKERRTENIEQGFEELKREFVRNGIQLSKGQFKRFMKGVIDRYNFNEVDDFYAAIGYSGINLLKLMPGIKNFYLKFEKEQEDKNKSQKHIPHSKKDTDGIIIEGFDGCLINFPKCCKAERKDQIIGFITRGHGISIHRVDCKNIFPVRDNIDKLDRFVSVFWEGELRKKYLLFIDILAAKKNNVISALTLKLSEFRLQINSFKADSVDSEKIYLTTSIYILHLRQLGSIYRSIAKIDGVITIKIYFKKD